MFTGISEEIGTVLNSIAIAGGRLFRISCRLSLEDLAPNDSISVNGVCLTATNVEKTAFEATTTEETLQRSTLKDNKTGDRVNLERAMRLSDRLGGHLVQGHVDGVGKIVSVTARGKGRLIKIEIPRYLSKYIIEKGSIAVDGISLTIAELEGNVVTVSVIPHTLENTTLQFSRSGMKVNIEVDYIGKYVERFIQHQDRGTKMDEQRLRSMGY